MFKFDDDEEKSAKSSVIQEIMAMMDDREGSKLKKPAAVEISATSMDPAEDGEDEMESEGEMPMASDMDEMVGEGAPSPDELEKIKELYNKYCV